MVFKRFRAQVIVRVLFIAVILSAFAWCLVNQYHLRAVYLGVGAIVLVVEFCWYVERFNRDIKTFLISLQQRDFATHFQSTGKGKSFDELYQVLNQISETFRGISAEREVQHRYLEMLVEHVRVGILSIDKDEKIHLANQAVKDLLRKRVLTGLQSLEHVDDALVRTIREIESGETRLAKIQIGRTLLQLAIHASEFKLEDKYFKLISLQDIRSELDAREIEAWQKLIRVLSHEIMNSVSPIISLSGTLHSMVGVQDDEGAREGLMQRLDKGLEAIKVRSEGLYSFTQNYRKLVGLPKLNPEPVVLCDFAERVRLLMQPRMDEKQIEFTVHSVEGNILLDAGLMEQVVINLLLNAIDAVEGRPVPHVMFRISGPVDQRFCMHVADNGEGMDAATAERIFIPFFTTKKNGSGIGLAISKQIVQMHKAEIEVKTILGEGTEFFIFL